MGFHSPIFNEYSIKCRPSMPLETITIFNNLEQFNYILSPCDNYLSNLELLRSEKELNILFCN